MENHSATSWFAPPPQLLDVGHSRVAYRVSGQGPDIVFIHGWPLHGATFRDVVELVRDDFTCHVIDLPGAGFSEWDQDSPISIRDHARTVRQVIDQLGLERFALVGHDSGATIARWVADGDERVSGIVMGNTEIPGHRSTLLQLYLWTAKLPGGRALLPWTLSVPWLRRSPMVLGGCFQDVRAAEGAFESLFLEPMKRSKQVAAGQMRLLDGFDWAAVDGLADVHRRLRPPVQLIWGTDDPFFPLREARRMLNQFGGGAELVTLEGRKLFAHEESPDEFAAAMRGFLERCFADSSAN